MSMPVIFVQPELPRSSDTSEDKSSSASLPGVSVNMPVSLPQSELLYLANDDRESEAQSPALSIAGGPISVSLPPELLPTSDETEGQGSSEHQASLSGGPMNMPDTSTQPQLPPTSESSDETEAKCLSPHLLKLSQLLVSLSVGASLIVSIITPSVTSPQNVEEEEVRHS